MIGTGFEFYFILLVFAIPGIVIGFTVHEYCHALVATSFGDPTPRSQGRLTLNPATQIYPLGLVMLVLFGFGYARPVEYNPRYVRGGGQRAWLSLVGPLSNLLLAALFGILLRVLIAADPEVQACVVPSFALTAAGYVYWLLTEAFFINVILCVFNLIPIPPLDGYGVAEGLLRGRFPAPFQWIDRNRVWIYVVALLLFFILPNYGSGGVSISTPIVGAANLLWERVVNSAPPLALFPNFQYLFEPGSNSMAQLLLNPCSPF
ncbi:MAG: site-2 protease family protein [Candidatus Dormibacteria bacterium]